jgi:hypothetical protein
MLPTFTQQKSVCYGTRKCRYNIMTGGGMPVPFHKKIGAVLREKGKGAC